MAIDELTGDVSAVGPGVVAATVNSVGGSSASNVNTATTAANSATNANTASTLVKRDASGNFAAGNITATTFTLDNNSANKITDNGYGGVGIYSRSSAQTIIYSKTATNQDKICVQVSINGASIGETTHSPYPLYMSAPSGADIIWYTDGAGDIGATVANRPNNLFLKSTAVVGNLNTNAGTVRGEDSAVSDSNQATDLTVRAGNKTAGTGNGGTLTLSSGSSAGGNVGQVLIKTGSSTRIIADNNGRVAIGNQTPQNRLHLDNQGSNSIAFQMTNSTTGNSSSTAGARFIMNQSELRILNNENASIVFYTNGAISAEMTAAHDLKLIGALASAYQRVVATTGGTTTINDHVNYLILDPAGTLATYTITMPANPNEGQEVVVCTSQTITALTQNPSGSHTLNGGIAGGTLAANGSARWVFANNTWYRVG